MTAKKFHVNVIVGSETGLLKGVNVEKQIWDNLNKDQQVDKDKDIKVMCWGSQNQDEVCLGLRNRTVVTYDMVNRQLSSSIEVPGGDGHLVGLAKYEEKFITCVESGLLKIWGGNEESMVEIDAEANLHRMRQNPAEPHMVCTGGKENDLKIWDLQKPEEPVFRAKNVRPDWLQLRVPVWVLDMTFLPDSRKVVTCTGHHQVRVYDPSTSQRRPVIDMTFDEYPLVSMGLLPNGNQVIVGNTHGRMALVDIRKGGAMVQTYKGFAGSIRCIQCHASKPLVASCGLDRHLRIHDINSKELLHKFYLKSRLNSLLFVNDWEGPKDNPDKSEAISGMNTAESEDGSNEEEDDKEVEEIWKNMDMVGSKKNIIMGNRGKARREKLRLKAGGGPPAKKKKKTEIQQIPSVSKGKTDRKHKKRKSKKSASG